jgi:hypothetical protein
VEVDGASQGTNGESAAASPEEDAARDSVTELLEQLAREMTALVFYEARLAASRNRPRVLRAVRDVGAGLAVALALVTGFALLNAAAVLGLATAMSAWAAALVLALAWSVIGGLLALFLLARARGAAEWSLEDAERARAEAEQAVRDTLERLAPAITAEIALAAVPMAGDMAGGVIDAGEELMDSADEVMDALTEEMPGGGVVNQIWDVVLIPGRFGVRVATTVLKRSDSKS